MNGGFLQELQRAAGSFSSGDFASALAVCDQVLRHAPSDAEALHLKAMALGKLGRIDEASRCFEAALKVHPQKDAVLSNYGNALSNAGRRNEALAAYRKAVDFNPRFLNGWFNLGLAARAAGDVAAAEGAFRQAVALDPKNAKAQNSLGALLSSTGRANEALAAFGAALSADPAYVPALINRGGIFRDKRDLENAIADFSKAATLMPGLFEAHYQLANVQRLAGAYEDAERSFKRALMAEPTSVVAHTDLAHMLWELGRARDFTGALDAAITANPTEALLVLRADLALRSNDGRAALKAAQQVIDRYPGNPAGHVRMARVMRGLGRAEDAIAYASKAHAADVTDFAILHDYAEALLAAGQAARAAAALAVEPPAAHLQKHIALQALALRASGDDSYKRLYDYDRFAKKLFIRAPRGFASLEAFNEAVLAAIKPLHRKQARPIDQTLYGGTQSFGSLWDEPDPVIQLLREALLEASARYVDELPDDPAHPFLKRKSRELVCTGSWSVMLASGGGHVDHYHPRGWISASYYVRIPPEVSAGEKAGFLRLGASGVAGLSLPPERWFRPEEGSVIIFPSYIWHGVEPFAAASPRVTAPFDLAPR